MHIWCSFCLDRPMFDRPQLDSLMAVLREHLPSWYSRLRASCLEDDPDAMAIRDPSQLYEFVHESLPPRRGLGRGVLWTKQPGARFYLHYCDTTYPPDMNRLSIEFLDLPSIEGSPVVPTVHKLFRDICAQLPITYGHAHLREEFEAKNMHSDQEGTWAVGIRLTKYLPGLYWLNYFGNVYVNLIGRDQLVSAPASEAHAISDGVLLSLADSPESWNTPAYQAREEAVLAHLGPQYFFTRSDPNRETVAPDFWGLYKQRTRN